MREVDEKLTINKLLILLGPNLSGSIENSDIQFAQSKLGYCTHNSYELVFNFHSCEWQVANLSAIVLLSSSPTSKRLHTQRKKC